MKKLIKIAAVAFAALAVLLIVGVLVLFSFIDGAARKAVENGSTYALQVPTTLDKADVNVFGGAFAMAGLTVSNPEGYETAHFLKLEDAGVAVDLASLNQEVIELPTLTLTDLDLNLERRNGKANYQVIIDNLKRFESGDKPADQPKEEQDAKKLTIRKIEIRNIRAHVRLIPLGGELTEAEVVVPEIILENVGSDGSGASIGEVTNIILKAVFASVLATGENILPEEMFQDLGAELSSLASLAEQGVNIDLSAFESLDGIDDEAKKAVDDLDNTVRNILGGG